MIYTLKELRNRPEKTIRLKKNEFCPELESCPSTGKNPCISGMRKNFWGMDSKIVIKSGYAYLISQ